MTCGAAGERHMFARAIERRALAFGSRLNIMISREPGAPGERVTWRARDVASAHA